jgi:hypothetical protein
MPKGREHEYLAASDVKANMQKDFERVIIDIIEVNPVPSPPPPLIAPKQFSVAYRLRDTRQSPPFVSGIAHLHLTEGEDVMKWLRDIVRDYNDNIERFRVR